MLRTAVALLAFASACEDPGVAALQRRAESRLIQLDAVGKNEAGFARDYRTLLGERGRLREGFASDASAGALAEGIRAAGGTQERLGRPGAPGQDVAFHFSLGLARLSELGRLGGDRTVRLDGIACERGGCTVRGVLVAVPVAQPDATTPTLADLPPRPWWPPASSAWSRLRRSVEELDRRRTALGETAKVVDVAHEVGVLRQARRAATARTTLVAGAAEDAASCRTPFAVEAFEGESDIAARVRVGRGCDELQARLALRGQSAPVGGGHVVRIPDPRCVRIVDHPFCRR